jgi:transcriptional regulator GlxA family with amidase domain
LAGPATISYELAVSHEALAGLRLRPGVASAVMGCPVDEFTNMRVPVDSIFGVRGSRIAESLLQATTPTPISSIIARHFADVKPELDRSVARAVALLRANPESRVSALAADVGLSERQLRRRFQAAVGYGPKRLGRVFRFQRLLDSIHASHGRPDWSHVAIAAGYTDQSHMINECVTLTGGPPTTLPVAVLSNTAAASQF